MATEQRTVQSRRLRTPKVTRYSIVSYSVPACLIAVTLMFTGCGATIAALPSGAHPAERPTMAAQGSRSDHLLMPVVLRNPAPGTLDISVSVAFDQPTTDESAMLEVGLSFLSGGKVVQFAGDERVTCQGAALSLKGHVAVFRVLRAPTARVAGATIRCDYAAGGAVAGIALEIPPAPAIASPQPHAEVVRSTQTLVTYRADPATITLLGIVALAPSSPSPKALARLNPAGPLQQATVDTSGFAPGPGSLVLTASVTPRIAQTGVPFHSVNALGTATVPVAVTWI